MSLRYQEIFERCASTTGGFLHAPDSRLALEVSDEEREVTFEKLYNTPGFALWLGNFRDCGTDQVANDMVSDFVRRKISERINDPIIASKLITCG